MIDPVNRSSAVPAFRDAAVLWVTDGQYARVVDAAVACIEAGVPSTAIDEVAGSSASDPYAERLDLVSAALDDLGLDALPATQEDTAQQGAAIMIQALSRGELTADALGTWVTGGLTCEMRDRVEAALDDPR